ncbi:MAG TPA: alpha/beta hydrolase, partial [Candidatus Polarisedimenticolia bacterium]|nr:alpha/beta hydrolase [Candidatus Polarisedimenticolia bacterium]
RTAVSACGLTTYRALIDAGALNRHGIYYYVPGILRVAEAGEIVSLIAPRPFLSLNGEEDGASPLEGLYRVHRDAGKIYRLLGARRHLARRTYPAGHEFTDAMLRDTLRWFERRLRPEAFVAP